MKFPGRSVLIIAERNDRCQDKIDTADKCSVASGKQQHHSQGLLNGSVTGMSVGNEFSFQRGPLSRAAGPELTCNKREEAENLCAK